MVEVTGLEPTTSWSRTKRATKLRYTSPYLYSLIIIAKTIAFVKRYTGIFSVIQCKSSFPAAQHL